MSNQNQFLSKIYGLRENPFAARSGVAPIASFVGRDRERGIWTKVVTGRKRGRGSSLNFVVGDYGYGKTFTLYAILEQFRDDPDILKVYMKLLREDATAKFGVDFIQRIFSAIDLSAIDKKAVQTALGQLPSLLNTPALVLARWLDGDELATLFLTGREKLKTKDLATLGLRQNMTSTDIAKEYLLAWLTALMTSKVSILLMCIDEAEYLFSQMRGAKLANVLNSVREIYDLPTSPEAAKLGIKPASMVFFFGISDSGMQNLTNLVRREAGQGGPVAALMSRQQATIELQALSKEETEDLIKRRLSYDASDNRQKRDPLIPYTEDFVDYVYELTLGNPREIVERCDYTLEDGLEQQIPRITRAFARKVFESHLLSVESPTQALKEKTPKKSRSRQKQ